MSWCSCKSSWALGSCRSEACPGRGSPGAAGPLSSQTHRCRDARPCCLPSLSLWTLGHPAALATVELRPCQGEGRGGLSSCHRVRGALRSEHHFLGHCHLLCRHHAVPWGVSTFPTLGDCHTSSRGTRSVIAQNLIVSFRRSGGDYRGGLPPYSSGGWLSVHPALTRWHFGVTCSVGAASGTGSSKSGSTPSTINVSEMQCGSWVAPRLSPLAQTEDFSWAHTQVRSEQTPWFS